MGTSESEGKTTKISSKTVRYFDSKTDKEKTQESNQKDDPYPGNFEVPEERKKTHRRGNHGNSFKEVQHKKLKAHVKSTETKYEFASKQAARFELLLTEEAGYLEPEEGEKTYEISQNAIASNVDIASACKHFKLDLEHGPYAIDYTRNGRQLLLGGKRGHVAAFDWISKKLLCEINVMEAVNDVKWLHTENLFAVAQKKWTYVYDNQGIEIHCLKQLNDVLKLDFLPFHFLLVTCSQSSFLQYLDISVGKIVATIPCKLGRLSVMTHNPYNAVQVIGNPQGTVSMWTPTCKQPVVKMLCHKGPVTGVAVDKRGLYMATAGQDRQVKIFDVRTYKPLHAYHFKIGPSNLSFSDKGMLAVSYHNTVDIFKNPCSEQEKEPYLRHDVRFPINDLAFCPFEDVLGVGRSDGFESLLVPGCGEANYDSMENNPYRSKSQRREWEVKALLEKIQPDMITLDPMDLGVVDKVTAAQRLEDKEKLFGKQTKEVFNPKYKKKGKSSSGNVQKRKKIVRENEIRKNIRKTLSEKRKILDDDNDVTTDNKEMPIVTRPALSRFKTKKS